MKPVVQEEKTGCAIASAAALAGISYNKAKNIANEMGIFAEDESLWSETKNIRQLLLKLRIRAVHGETKFTDWDSLPDCAILSIKWHFEKGKPYWHWVVFVREGDLSYVLDSRKELKTNRRTDFGRMKPKWYIEIMKATSNHAGLFVNDDHIANIQNPSISPTIR